MLSPPLPTLAVFLSSPYTAISTYLSALTVTEVRYILLNIVLFFYLINSIVGWLNTQRLDHPLPSVIKRLYSKEVLARYESNKQYIKAKSTFGTYCGIYEHIISFTMWFGAFYPWLDQWIKKTLNYDSVTGQKLPIEQQWSTPWIGVFFSLILQLISTVLNLPISYYSTFVLEEKFGFNRTTHLTFVKDIAKEIALTWCLGLPTLYCIFWIIVNYRIETYWWLLVLFSIAFQVLIFILQPYIMQIFRSFIDINEGIAFCTRGKSVSKYVKNRYFYPLVDPEDPDKKRVLENIWETRDSQFKGQKLGGIVQLRMDREKGTWVLSDAKKGILETMKEEKKKKDSAASASSSSEAASKPEETELKDKTESEEDKKDFIFATAVSPKNPKSPEEVKEWAIIQDEAELAEANKEKTVEEIKAEMNKTIDPTDSLPFHVKKIDFSTLKNRLQSMADEHNFKFKNVCVTDGSTRSEHSNAFFMGFWWFRRICLFDTLLKNLSIDSICGVLGHEMGHCVMLHIPQAFVIGIVQISLFIWLIAQMLYNKQLHGAFYVDTSNEENLTIWIGMHAVSCCLEPLGLVTEFFGNWHTRKNEYEADAFAVQKFKENYAKDLITGLKSLASENKSHLNPHPLYVTWKHSHPTLQQRAEFISRLSKERDGKELVLEELE